MKKILILIISFGLFFGLIGIGTQAYFSDVESSRINTFTAGFWDNPKEITAFSFQGFDPAVIGVINEGAHTVALTVPLGTNLADLVPTIVITGASVNPLSGVANNFTTPQTYTVTAVDDTTQEYIVTVTIADSTTDDTTAPSTDTTAETTDTAAPSTDDTTAPSTIATITSENYTVSADGTTAETITNIPFGTDKSTFLASLTKGETNQTWVDTGIADTVVTGNTLVVTAQDGTTAVTYTVTVNEAPVVELTSIAITTPADKLTYTAGDQLDITGLVVTGTYSDGSTSKLTMSTSDVSGFDSTVPATGQTLTITIDGKTATYTIDVAELKLDL